MSQPYMPIFMTEMTNRIRRNKGKVAKSHCQFVSTEQMRQFCERMWQFCHWGMSRAVSVLSNLQDQPESHLTWRQQERRFSQDGNLKKQNSLAFAPINALIFLLTVIPRQIFLTHIPNVLIRLYLRS